MISSSANKHSSTESHSLGNTLASSWIWFCLLPLASALTYKFLLNDRPDYMGHFLAGFGATLLVMWAIAVVSEGAPSAVGIGTLVCLVLGLLAEATVFSLGGFDNVDLCSQSLGGALAGLGVLQTAVGDDTLDQPEDSWLPLRNRRARIVLLAAGVSLIVGTGAAFA